LLDRVCRHTTMGAALGDGTPCFVADSVSCSGNIPPIATKANSPAYHFRIREQGFSLLEVMITMGILLALVVGVSSMLRSSVDLKMSLSRDARITHRLSLSMTKVSWDIEHAFVVDRNDSSRGGFGRHFKTIFKIDKVGDTDKLYMTITGNVAGAPGATPGDTAYVVYEVRDAPDSPGRKHLYRGISAANREDLKEDPPMKIFVRNIKLFKVSPWRGDEWSADQWDSSRGEWRDRPLPKMVRLEIETWNDDDEIPREGTADQSADNNVVGVKTVIAIPQARGMQELRQPSKTVKWY
jgi:prepilin-type N-terminal cleavage/methylation domain-containing protein